MPGLSLVGNEKPCPGIRLEETGALLQVLGICDDAGPHGKMGVSTQALWYRRQ